MISELKAYMKEHGLSQRQVSAQLDVSPSVINQYLKGAYPGDIKNLESGIRALLKRAEEKVLDRHTFEYVPTPKSKRALDVIRYAHLENDISLITGAAGLGKTQTLKEYVRTEKNVIFIETEPTYTAKVLLREICLRLNLSEKGSLHDMSQAIIERLKDTGRLIIIDEAEYLPYRALETLRRIHDKAGVGLVLAGLPRLLMNMRGRNSEHAQLYSRVGFHYSMGDRLEAADIHALAEATLNTDEFNDLLFEKCGANARRLNKLLRGAIRTSELNKRSVDKNIIIQFSEMLVN